jgi:hypothetical protein
MFENQVNPCLKRPYAGVGTEQPVAVVYLKLKRDGTVDGMPVPEGTPSTPFLRADMESVIRAIIQCQPYKLPLAHYEEWKFWAPMFRPKGS